MGSTTPLHALPYPASGDAFNVPVDVENLANAVDNALPYYGSTAPANPVVGTLWWNSSSGVAQLWDGTAWVPAQPAPYAARYTITGTYGAFPNATWHQFGGVTFAEDYDPWNMFNAGSSQFVLPVTGLWQVRGRLTFPANATGVRGAGIAWNSASVDLDRQKIDPASGSIGNVVEVNSEGSITAAGQFVQLWGYQNSGATMAVGGSGEFSVKRLGPLA